MGDPRLVIPVHIAHATLSIDLFVYSRKREARRGEGQAIQRIARIVRYDRPVMGLPCSSVVFLFPVCGGPFSVFGGSKLDDVKVHSSFGNGLIFKPGWT